MESTRDKITRELDALCTLLDTTGESTPSVETAEGFLSFAVQAATSLDDTVTSEELISAIAHAVRYIHGRVQTLVIGERARMELRGFVRTIMETPLIRNAAMSIGTSLANQIDGARAAITNQHQL